MFSPSARRFIVRRSSSVRRHLSRFQSSLSAQLGRKPFLERPRFPRANISEVADPFAKQEIRASKLQDDAGACHRRENQESNYSPKRLRTCSCSVSRCCFPLALFSPRSFVCLHVWVILCEGVYVCVIFGVAAVGLPIGNRLPVSSQKTQEKKTSFASPEKRYLFPRHVKLLNSLEDSLEESFHKMLRSLWIVFCCSTQRVRHREQIILCIEPSNGYLWLAFRYHSIHSSIKSAAASNEHSLE